MRGVMVFLSTAFILSAAIFFGSTDSVVPNFKNDETKKMSLTLSPNVDLYDLLLEYRRRSYLHWSTNEEGVSSETAKDRAKKLQFPTREALVDAVEEEFNTYFPAGTSIEAIVAFMETHGANECSPDQRTYDKQTSAYVPKYFNRNGRAGTYVCNVTLLVPLAHEHKSFDPNPDDLERDESIKKLFGIDHTPTVEEFLKLQDELRFKEHWQFRVVADRDDQSKLGVVRLSGIVFVTL